MPFPARPPVASPSRVLGLDPGLQTTGYGVLELLPGKPPRVCEAGVIRSAADRTASPTGMAARVKALYDGLVEVLDQWRPTAMAVEQLFAHYNHPRTAILMAHARGCFFLAGAQRGVPVLSYPPGRVKKTVTGHGRASKEQMQHAVMRELGLAKLPEPHDVADALGIALCHHYSTATSLGVAAGGTVTGVNRALLLGTDDDSLTDDIAPDEAA